METVAVIFRFVYKLGIIVLGCAFVGGISVSLVYFMFPNYKHRNELGLFLAILFMAGLYFAENEKVSTLSETIENMEAEAEYLDEDLTHQIYRLEEELSYLNGCFEFSFSAFPPPEDFREIVLTEPKEEIISLYNMAYNDAEYYFYKRDGY